jgi:cell division protein FtsW
MPVTGQTLPLVSMGGSSILFSSAALGIILSVSRGINKEEVVMEASSQPPPKEMEQDSEQETESVLENFNEKIKL